jgi:hypothetical protein
LWDIAAVRLVPAERSAANLDRYWRQVYRANRSLIGARVMGTEEHPLVSLATSYFRTWVVEQAPNLADPNISGPPSGCGKRLTRRTQTT